MEKPGPPRPPSRLERWLVAWVAFAIRRERTVLLTVALLTLGLGLYAALHLGVNMDNKTTLLSADLPFQERARDFEAHFPLLNDALLVVVDGPSPDRAREAARRLASQLERRPDLARSVFLADADPFFERHALLYRSVEELESFSDQMVRFQPVLGELARRPDLTTLTRLIRRTLDPASPPPPEELARLLDGFGDATVAVYAERPLHVSWQDLLLRESGFQTRRFSTLVVDPALDFDALLPAGSTLAGIRGLAKELGIDAEAGLRARITGYPALNDEEMRGLLMDIGVAGLFSFAMVLGVLAWAFRSGRMVLASAITLVVGLVWTAAFAAAAVGRVNVISIAFAVLFIGLGVDFAIHLGLHVLEQRSQGRDHATAFAQATQEVGPALALCALTTSVGFFAFVPTDYKGVAELGLISGTGMFVILALTLTLFPALLTRVLRVERCGSGGSTGHSFAARVSPSLLLLGSAVLAALAIGPALAVRFDSNVVKMRNPDTESVVTWNDLLATGTGSPWYADLLAPSLDVAAAKAHEIAQLPEVSETLTLLDYVPADQQEKLAILEDLAFFLDVPSSSGRGEETSAEDEEQAEVQEQIQALRALHRALSLAEGELWRTGRLAGSARLLQQRLGLFLDRIEAEEDPRAVLATVEESLLGHFPAQMKRLRNALDPGPVTLDGLPAPLRARMLAADGKARLQIFPEADLADDDRALVAFVSAVQSVAPEVTGLPVNLVEFGRATGASLRQALATAALAIAVLLLVMWRRVGDALLALAPLCLAGLWTVGLMGLIDLPFNFANVVVLPLLLGMGVDSGIHLVRRARSGGPGARDLATTTTGRAVFLSAFTTLVSFGSLMSSGHRGIASLGAVLVIGMGCTLAANLITLPAWFALPGTFPAKSPGSRDRRSTDPGAADPPNRVP